MALSILSSKPTSQNSSAKFPNFTAQRNPAPNPKLDFIVNGVKELQSSKHSKPTNIITQLAPDADEPPDRGSPTSGVQISHPWREWIELMECLLKKDTLMATETVKWVRRNRTVFEPLA